MVFFHQRADSGVSSRFIIAHVDIGKLRIDICHLEAVNNAICQKSFVLVAREFALPSFCV